MRILCQASPQKANMILGWKSVCEMTENQFVLWHPGQQPAFDAFDEADPSIFILTENLVSRELQRCFKTYSNTKIIDASEAVPGFDSINLKPGTARPELKSDLLLIGDYDDSELLDQFILPLSRKYRLKIFGDTRWPIPEYLGPVDLKTIPDLVASTKLCLNVSMDRLPPERLFQYQGLGSLVLSSREYGIGNMEIKNNPETFLESVNYITKQVVKKNWRPNRGNRWGDMYFGGIAWAFKNHTYFLRVIDMFRSVGYHLEADKVMEAYQTTINSVRSRKGHQS